ncbi:MAG: glycosyltransferase family 4 protein [Burkholderiaceae bacterium]
MAKVVVLAHHAVSLLNFRRHFIRDLVAQGAQVFCLAPDYDRPSREEVQALGAVPMDYCLARTGMNPIRDVRDMLLLLRMLHRLKPDVTFAFSIKPVIYGTFAAWLARVPRRVVMIEGAGYVFTAGGIPPGWRRRGLRWIVEKLYRTALSRAHRVIFLNPDDLQEFVERKLANPNRTALLGGIGVDLDEWAVAPPVYEPVTFLLVARLLREKGILEYVEAARCIKRVHPAVRFILLGGLDTNPGALSRQEIDAWVKEGILEWPGHVVVQPWIAKSSVFVLPSYREGVPRSTQEAMAMGRPIITTDAPGCRETVVNGYNGFLVPVRDINRLMHAMLCFVKSPDLILPMGAASREIAEELFDVKKVNAVLLKWLYT